jgi:hypothetical protein
MNAKHLTDTQRNPVYRADGIKTKWALYSTAITA